MHFLTLASLLCQCNFNNFQHKFDGVKNKWRIIFDQPRFSLRIFLSFFYSYNANQSNNYINQSNCVKPILGKLPNISASDIYRAFTERLNTPEQTCATNTYYASRRIACRFRRLWCLFSFL